LLLSSGQAAEKLHSSIKVKYIFKMKVKETYQHPNEFGYYGKFGGAYIPEMLHLNVEELIWFGSLLSLLFLFLASPVNTTLHSLVVLFQNFEKLNSLCSLSILFIQKNYFSVFQSIRLIS
jgi:hypothetical protein